MSNDIKKIPFDELTSDRLRGLIAGNDTFQVVAVSDIGTLVAKLEAAIENAGMRCRVFTEYRASSLLGACLVPTAPLAWMAGIGMAAHNLATFNPDYQIGKNKLASTVTVKYMK